jgi:hypothetical protein
MRNSSQPFFYMALILAILSCTTGTSYERPEEIHETNEIVGVSVWDRISSRSEPRRSSERATLLSLGEQFMYLDSSAIDSANNNTRMLFVQLSDSSKVWVYDFATVLEARPAAVISQVPLYLRPDLLTITEEELNAMEIVAVTEEWDDWIKVVNEKKERVGWIKKEKVSYEMVDLAFALLVKRQLEEGDPEKRIEKIEEMMDQNPYPNTIFLAEVQKRLDQERETLRESDDDEDRDERRRRDRD